MEAIGVQEQEQAQQAYEARLLDPESSETLPPEPQMRFDSFYPRPYPEHVTRPKDGNYTHESLSDCQKFLPVHYFDTICGTSTGG